MMSINVFSKSDILWKAMQINMASSADYYVFIINIDKVALYKTRQLSYIHILSEFFKDSILEFLYNNIS